MDEAAQHGSDEDAHPSHPEPEWQRLGPNGRGSMSPPRLLARHLDGSGHAAPWMGMAIATWCRTGSIAMVGLVSGCTDRSVQRSDDETTTGPSSSGTSTSSTAGNGAQTDAASSAGDATSATSDAEESADEAFPVWDLPGATATPCGAAESSLYVSTPAGELEARHAWWGWDFCCFARPRLVISEVDPEFEDAEVTTRPVLEVATHFEGPAPDEWSGQQSATLSFRSVDDVVTLEESYWILWYSVDVSEPYEDTLLRAEFDIEVDGWTVVGTVAAPYCELVDRPACTCD